MARLIASIRTIAALAFLGLVILAPPAAAQQPSSVNPNASAVKEQQLLRELNRVQGRVTIPDQKEGVLIQQSGREWQVFHERTLRWIGAIVILGTLVLIVAFYMWRGMIRLERGRSGQKILRFTAFERFVHWMTATCFILQALTGLNITFGKPLLLPLIGLEAFSTWSQAGKYLHNFLSIPFTLGVLLIFFMWIGANIPNRVDLEWIKRGGGLVGHDHPPAYRFNAGQKAIYWIQVLGGIVLVTTGYILIFPFYGTDIGWMQLAQIVHGVASMLFIAVMLAHIYIGSIGMEGAFAAMSEGTVDVNWAKEHHGLWVEQELARTGATEGQRQPLAHPAE